MRQEIIPNLGHADAPRAVDVLSHVFGLTRRVVLLDERDGTTDQNRLGSE